MTLNHELKTETMSNALLCRSLDVIPIPYTTPIVPGKANIKAYDKLNISISLLRVH